jgi:hypothetical protein
MLDAQLFLQPQILLQHREHVVSHSQKSSQECVLHREQNSVNQDVTQSLTLRYYRKGDGEQNSQQVPLARNKFSAFTVGCDFALSF